MSGAMNMQGAGNTRTLYMLVPPSPLFAAHWFFFVPDDCSDTVKGRNPARETRGKRIHVSGDRLNGFTLETIKGYDVRKHRAVGSRQFSIGLLGTQYLQQALSEHRCSSYGT